VVQDCNKGKAHQVLVVTVRKRSSQKVQGTKSCSANNISYYIKYTPKNSLTYY